MVNPSPRPPLKILVVDDDPVALAMAQRVLELDGFKVLAAKDGAEGLHSFLAHSPDLVLTDYSMPGMSGAELARRIKAVLQERYGELPMFIPIVVFTGLGDPEVLKECLDAGAVEFLTKPFSGMELRTRIHAIAKSASAHADLLIREAEERDEIAVIKHLLERLVEAGRATLPQGFIMETLATRRINGDVCAHNVSAQGIHFGLVCDPMGHGLMAGVSEIPTMEVFNALSARDLPLPSILSEINRKLLHLLPWGRFSCAIVFRMDLHTGLLSVVNAGMPDALLFRRDGSLACVPSTSIPLGIQGDLGSLVVTHLQLKPGDCLFACSDGLTDLVGKEEMKELFRREGETGFPPRLRALLEQRVRDRELADDVSWCLWPFRTELAWASPPRPGNQEAATEQSMNIHLSFRPSRTRFDALGPDLAGFLGFQGAPPEVAQTLAVTLSEAIMNAVDHGLLSLDSTLKLASFEAFECARTARLEAESMGGIEVCVAVHRKPDGTFSHVRAQVVDAGPGFDWRRCLAGAGQDDARPYGRGLTLIKALAGDLSFNEAGNAISFSIHARAI